jgi:hypothetical protein
MKKYTLTYLLPFLTVAFFLTSVYSCKKENNNSTKLIDEVVGTYIAYDTIRWTPHDSCGGDGYNTYSFTISKQSETSIKISKLGLFCNDVNANVSETNITLLTSSCSSYSPTVTKTGNNLYFSYSDFVMGTGVPCNGAGSVKAVKQ